MASHDPIRKRIVIDLSSPRGVSKARTRIAPRRRRWPRVLAILAGLVLAGVAVAGVGGYLWWRNYQTTPAYALALLIDAAQHNDMDEFGKRIDEAGIARSLVGSVSEQAMGRYGLALSGSVRQQIDRLLPSLMPRLQQTIRDEVAKEIKELAAKSQPKPFIVIALAVPSFVTITTEGDNAKALAPIRDRTIELKMRRDATSWKVTELKDEVLVQRVVDSVIKELPAIGGIDMNIPLLKNPRRRSAKPR